MFVVLFHKSTKQLANKMMVMVWYELTHKCLGIYFQSNNKFELKYEYLIVISNEQTRTPHSCCFLEAFFFLQNTIIPIYLSYISVNQTKARIGNQWNDVNTIDSRIIEENSGRVDRSLTILSLSKNNVQKQKFLISITALLSTISNYFDKKLLANFYYIH